MADYCSAHRSWFVLAVCVCGACSGASSQLAAKPAGKDAATAKASEWPLAPKSLTKRQRASEPAALGATAAVLTDVLNDAFAVLSKQPAPAHYLAYQVTQQEQWEITASDGALVDSGHDRYRLLDVDLRVGSLARDDTHPLPGEGNDSTYRGGTLLPLQGEGQAFKDALWLATDQEYEAARQRWMRVEANQELDQETEESAPSYSPAPKTVASIAPPQTQLEPKEWERRLIALSAVAERYPTLMSSSVSLTVVNEARVFVNSDGSRVQTGDRRVRVAMQVGTLSEDGLPLSRFDAVDVHSLEAVPDDAALAARFTQLFEDVQNLLKAPLIEPYAGPAILDGRAAGVFFHEIFGHRIEGHRQDDETEGQTFSSLVGQQIMAPFLDIYDDPTLFELNDVELNGHYFFDDEGVSAQRAQLVHGGVLRGFLQSRAPTRLFPESNGHGRREAGYGVVARQANLVVEPQRVVSPETLEQALLAEVERQGLPYGLRFSEITGGYTQTQRYETQAFKVMPVMVYRVHPDGREELVRGVDIEGTPLTALSKIVLAGNDFQTFNGVCGAESGWVPVSATSPSILVSQIEVARQEQTKLRPPLLPPPGAQVQTKAPSNPAAPSGTVPDALAPKTPTQEAP